MKKCHCELSDSEWRIMQALWKSGSAMSARDIMDDTAEDGGWSVHTVISFLKRMETKGAVKIHDGRPITYSAALDRDDAVRRETNELLSRIYGGERRLMIQCAVEAAPLSEEERNELIAILKGGK